MQERSILIFNPDKNPLADSVVTIVNQHTEHQPLVIESPRSNFEASLEPNVIIAIFPSACSRSMCPGLFDAFLDRFPFVPVIAVLDSENVCNDCSVWHRRIWSFVSIPVSVTDIMLSINKFLPMSPADQRSEVVIKIKRSTTCQLLKGKSPSLEEVRQKISQVAAYDVTALLIGETGTGKELCAKMIHFQSNRSNKSFVPVNCGAIPNDLFESELFGYEKGAFTGANESRSGLIKSAQGGTLFLDEVESLSIPAQVKLLRFLEEQRFKPLGESTYVSTDVRLVAAGKENLWELVERNRFRRDLFYRLNVFPIRLSPLRERREDIPILVDHFVKRFADLYDKPIKGITPGAVLKLVNNNWPGNVRELENVIRRSVIVNTSGWIDLADVELDPLSSAEPRFLGPLKKAKRRLIEDFERRYLENLLAVYDGNISKAARFAEKERSAFCRLLTKYNVSAVCYRTSSKLRNSSMI